MTTTPLAAQPGRTTTHRTVSRPFAGFPIREPHRKRRWLQRRWLRLPLAYGGGAHPCVLLSGEGTNHVFTSVWLDWYRSNGAEPYAAESVSTNGARINGGVRYLTRTDGRRNPMFERLFITVSPTFEEVLPTIANPVGLHAKDAVDRLWQESWGPDDFERRHRRRLW